MVDLKAVEKFFFKAMLAGYAANAPKTKVLDMPGYKEIRFQEGDFLLVDRYCVTPNSPKSAGTTTIWFQNVPVWVMNYGGFYKESVIPFLKYALRKTYEAHQFVGGRGPKATLSKSFFYVNTPRLNDFAKFEGREEIFHLQLPGGGRTIYDAKRDVFGYHEYWGMSLL